MRLSANWLVRNIALGFIELVRNTPQLVRSSSGTWRCCRRCPARARAFRCRAGSLLNIRGLYLPSLAPERRPTVLWPLALLVLLATPFVWRLRWSGLPLGRQSLLLRVAGCPLFAAGIDQIDYPALRGFNIAGGVQVVPELVALWAD